MEHTTNHLVCGFPVTCRSLFLYHAIMYYARNNSGTGCSTSENWWTLCALAAPVRVSNRHSYCFAHRSRNTAFHVAGWIISVGAAATGYQGECQIQHHPSLHTSPCTAGFTATNCAWIGHVGWAWLSVSRRGDVRHRNMLHIVWAACHFKIDVNAHEVLMDEISWLSCQTALALSFQPRASLEYKHASHHHWHNWSKYWSCWQSANRPFFILL